MKFQEVKALAPIFLLIVMSVVLHFFGDHFFADRLTTIAQRAEVIVAGFGVWGYVFVIAAYAFCAFFFIPLLIPLNVASGALYGPYVGTLVAAASITAGAAASAVSIRHVFTGLRGVFERRAGARRILGQVGRHGLVAVLLLRLAFIVPYMWQNIFLALTPVSLKRIVLVTALGSVPGAAVYSLLGAGLMSQDRTVALAGYLGVPILLFIAAMFGSRYLHRHYAEGDSACRESVDTTERE